MPPMPFEAVRVLAVPPYATANLTISHLGGSKCIVYIGEWCRLPWKDSIRQKLVVSGDFIVYLFIMGY